MLWLRTQRIGSDSLFLMSKLAKSPNSSRDILLSQAREANLAATSFLRMEREINLMRYHGFRGYLRERSILPINLFSSQRLSFGSTPPQDNIETKRSQPTTARVAFMITSAQRVTLSKDLGYTTQQIKLMKPIEASLILEHKLQPSDMPSMLPGLVLNYHSALSATQTRVDEVPEKPPDAPPSTKAQAPQYTSEDKADEEPPMLSLPILTAPAETEENTRLWYEVVQIRSDTTDTIGLYPDESEAELCLETKEHLAAKHRPDEVIRFEIRTTRK